MVLTLQECQKNRRKLGRRNNIRQCPRAYNLCFQRAKNSIRETKTWWKDSLHNTTETKIPWKPDDHNQHLYTWSPMRAGNLSTAAGFNIMEVSTIRRLWPPYYDKIKKYLGLKVFYLVCEIHTTLFGKWHAIRVVATKPKVDSGYTRPR